MLWGCLDLGLVRHLAQGGRRRLCTVSHHELVFLKKKKNPKLWRTSALGMQVIGNMKNFIKDTHAPVPLGSMIGYNANVIPFVSPSPSWLHDGWTGLSFLGAKCFSSECFSEANQVSLDCLPPMSSTATGHPAPQNQMWHLCHDSWHLSIPVTDLLTLMTCLFM